MGNKQIGTVSSRRLGNLLTQIDEKKLIVRPRFQRRLVWTSKVKEKFLQTVLESYPFPEIFVSAGELDETKLKRTEWLVDGQQRLSTLREYVLNSDGLKLKSIPRYDQLDDQAKVRFSDYEVAVRDLGAVSEEETKEIFSRINSADYSLKNIERLHARYGGEFKVYCEELAGHKFFIDNSVFTLADMRRMRDLEFCIILVATLLSTYFQRDENSEDFLHRYNDDFSDRDTLDDRLAVVFEFLDNSDVIEGHQRSKRKPDLFTLIVEADAMLRGSGRKPSAKTVGKRLVSFYTDVDARFKQTEKHDFVFPLTSIDKYLKAASKATNEKYSRVARAQVLSGLMRSKPKTA